MSILPRSALDEHTNQLQNNPLYYSLANRTALQEDTELEEYIVQMTNAPEIITKCSMHVSALVEKLNSP